MIEKGDADLKEGAKIVNGKKSRLGKGELKDALDMQEMDSDTVRLIETFSKR